VDNGATGQNRTAGLFITDSLTEEKIKKTKFLKNSNQKMTFFSLIKSSYSFNII
jgi:hypothetical protein